MLCAPTPCPPERSYQVFDGARTFVSADLGRRYLRIGSRAFLAPNAEVPVLADVLRAYAAGRDRAGAFSVEAARRGGETVLHVSPVDADSPGAGELTFDLVIERVLSANEARRLRLFDIDRRRPYSVDRELRPGRHPRLQLPAYWFGRRWNGRTANAALEHTDGENGPVYTVFYERHAYPRGGWKRRAHGVPAGELQVETMPLDSREARSNAGLPRRRVLLARGRRPVEVVLLPDGDSGVADGRAGFGVYTDAAFVAVLGRVAPPRVGALASALRAI
jgi:hypothetical protein